LLRIVAIAAVPLAVFGSAELTLRAAYPGKVSRWVAPSVSFAFHPVFLVAMKPNVDGSFTRSTKQGSVTTRWNTNADAFRGRPLREHRDGRIIVYGDSNVFASFSGLEDTFPYLLEKELHRLTHKDIEVVNAGVVASGPDQSLLRLETEVDRYRPDLVIFHVFADNDFGDLIRNRLFDVDSSGALVVTRHPRTIDHCLRPPRYGPCPPTATLVDALDARASSFVTYRAVRRVARMLTGIASPAREASPEEAIRTCLRVADAEYAVYKAAAPRTFSHFADHYDCDLALFPQEESSRVKVKLMEAVLTRAYEFARLKHVKFLVVIQPSSHDLTTNMRVNHEAFAKFSARYRPTTLSAAVEAILRSRQIRGLNLYDSFAGHDPRTLFFDEDNHWNNAGQRLAARETARYIVGRWPGGAPRGETIASAFATVRSGVGACEHRRDSHPPIHATTGR
jgi:hypothetical protein